MSETFAFQFLSKAYIYLHTFISKSEPFSTLDPPLSDCPCVWDNFTTTTPFPIPLIFYQVTIIRINITKLSALKAIIRTFFATRQL